ncbi:hypothetical protein LS68_006455 [Helicobacter sp. MIT 05-5293]|uniref:hypothetical protein n=1 Tax=Helicobacter sp. MIT 05-5293 TaxID=1548149 RepID=UPI00051D7427|nr:hypothetical protein [Helicobacter sp. MIT 05-5293]TLD80397.1 hypothetical protein LS68_006455 [Helicobacter sp. MIT 05-5293]
MFLVSFASACAGIMLACAGNTIDCHICESCQSWVRVGIGGMYANYQTQNDIGNYGGYLNLEVKGVTPNARFQFVGISRTGLAKSNASNKSLTLMGRDFDKNTSVFVELRPKVGVNLLTPHRPLYLNIAYTFDGTRSHMDLDDGIRTYIHQVGLDLDGIVRQSEKFRIEYGVGYDYVVGGSYDNSYTTLKLNGGYALRGSLGFAYDITQNVHCYMKANLKYQSLNDVANNIAYYPQSRSYTAGLELGFGF